jgi:CheY-like chemotaxis protein
MSNPLIGDKSIGNVSLPHGPLGQTDPDPKKQSQPPERESGSPEVDLNLGPATILVIEDEGTVLKVTKTILERNGYEVLSAANGLEGVDTFKRQADGIDLIILDMNMPLMNGAEASRRMREIRPTIPIVLSGGGGEEELERNCQDLGLTGYLCKPFRSRDLIGEVKQILTRLQMRCAGES